MSALTTTGSPALATDPGLAHDAALPHRDILLDPGALASELGAAAGCTVTLAEPLRVKYRLGESLRVLARVIVEGQHQLVSARMSRPGQQVRGVAPDTWSGSPLPPVAASEHLDTSWWTFPHDRRIRGLATLLAPTVELSQRCGLAGFWAASSTVRWTPERSLTLRALAPVGETVAFVKAYAPGTVDVLALAARHDLLADRLAAVDGSGRLRAPRALAAVPGLDLLVLEPVPGDSWDGLPAEQALDSWRLLGRSVAVLHGVPAGAAQAAGAELAHFARLDPAHLLQVASLVATARPDLADRVTALARALLETAPEAAEPVVLHGDCHPGNLLVAPGRASLIDLDQSGLGPSAADLGSLLARLQSGRLAGERSAADSEALGSAFLTGYAETRHLPAAHVLRWHTAAALLAEQAMRAVSRVRRPELSRLEALLALAESVRTQGALP